MYKVRQGRHQADRGETEKLFTPDFYLGEVFTFDTFLLCLSSKNKTAKQEFSKNSVVRDSTETGLFYVSVRNTYVYVYDVYYRLFPNFHQWSCETCRKKLKNLKIDL